jgi:hypothetical protein
MSDNTRFLTLHAAEAAPKFCGRNAEIPQSVALRQECDN